MSTRTRDTLFFAGWLGWAVFVLAHYYVQLWRALASFTLPSPAIPAAVALLLVAGTSLLICAASPRSRTINPGAWWIYQRRRVFLLGAALFTVPWAALHHQLVAGLARISLPGFPWAGEATGRSAAAFIGATLVAVAACSSGALVLRLLGVRASSRAEHGVFSAVTGIAIVSYGSLLLAFAHLYRPLSVAVLVAALILSGTVGRRGENGSTEPRVAAAVDSTTAIWSALAAVALGYGVVAALAPEKEFDALWYHLQLPRVWLEAGRPIDVVHEYVSLYPLTWELAFGAAMVLGGAVAAKLLHFACLPALAVLVGLAARRFTPGVSIAAVVAILVTTPTLLWESSTAYVDLALALHSAAACYALARYVQSQESAWRTVAALQFGIAAATKHLGVIVAVVALILYILSAARSHAGLVSRLRSAVVIALIAAVIPLPWYLRAWVASGNPVFPEMFAVFGAFPSSRWDAAAEQGLAGFKAHFGMGRSPAALLALPWNVTVHGALFAGSLGPLFIVLLPGLLRAGHRAVSAVPWLVCGVVVYAAIWASPISSFQMRFLMPVIAPLALLAGVALQRAGRAGWNIAPRRGALMHVVLVGLAALNLPPFVPWHEVDRRGWNGWLTHVVRSAPLRVLTGNESEATYLSREVPSFAAWRWINAHLPADARVLAFSGGDQFYASRFRISFDATMAHDAVWGGGPQSEADAVSHLRRLRITHVLFDRRALTTANAERLSIVSPQVQQACATEYDDGRYWLCRLD